MTQPAQQPAQQPIHEAFVAQVDEGQPREVTAGVDYALDSRLAQLHAAYPEAKARADEAAKQLKAITDGLKVELAALDAEERRFELAADEHSGAPALSLTYVEAWRLDSDKMKREAPRTYVRFAKKSGSWRLAPVRGQR